MLQPMTANTTTMRKGINFERTKDLHDRQEKTEKGLTIKSDDMIAMSNDNNDIRT